MRLNHLIGKELLPVPEALYTEIPKVMSTADPNRKMSASLGEKHNISVFSSADQIRKQIKSAVTDAGVEEPGKMSAGIENLFSLLKAAGDLKGHTSMMEQFTQGTLKYADLKEKVGSALVALSEPMRRHMSEIQADKKKYKQLIKASSAEIRVRAKANLDEIKEAVGLMVA